MNNKKEVVPLRTRKGSIYQKGTNETFKISRSKLNNFIDCPRCFYLERVKGLKDPGMPGWALNTAVDELLKKEFDHYRKIQKSHPFILKNKLNFIPFQHEKIDYWRDALRGGIAFTDTDTNLEIHGGVDDIWFNPDNNELIVVDYKAQSKNETVETETYLENQYHQSYKVQMDIYVYILRQMKFTVSDTAYFLVCNGLKTPDKFDATLHFDLTLVPYKTNDSWVKNKIIDMKKTLESKDIPEINKFCEKCLYLDAGKNFILK
jgi:hypothetical protein